MNFQKILRVIIIFLLLLNSYYDIAVMLGTIKKSLGIIYTRKKLIHYKI